MILQIVGTRIIGPHFGAGLDVPPAKWPAYQTLTDDWWSPVDAMDMRDREAARASRRYSIPTAVRDTLACR